MEWFTQPFPLPHQKIAETTCACAVDIFKAGRCVVRFAGIVVGVGSGAGANQAKTENSKDFQQMGLHLAEVDDVMLLVLMLDFVA